MKTILEYIVLRACEHYQHNRNEFHTAAFQSTFSEVTKSHPMITGAQAEAILLSIPGVTRTALCYWRYDDGDVFGLQGEKR